MPGKGWCHEQLREWVLDEWWWMMVSDGEFMVSDVMIDSSEDKMIVKETWWGTLEDMVENSENRWL